MAKAKARMSPLEKIKIYLSSLTARRCKYMYFNVVPEYPHLVVLTNGDPSILLAESRVLAIHLLLMTPEYYTEFTEIFGFKLSAPYVIHVEKVLKVIGQSIKSKVNVVAKYDNKNSLVFFSENDTRTLDEIVKNLSEEAKAKLLHDIEKNTVFVSELDNTLSEDYTSSDEDDSEIDSIDDESQITEANYQAKLQSLGNVIAQMEYSHAFGMVFDDYRAFHYLWNNVTEMLKYMTGLITNEEIYSQYTFTNENLEDLNKYRKSIYRLTVPVVPTPELNFKGYFDERKNLIYKEGEWLSPVYYLLHDGVSIPCISEFILRYLDPSKGDTAFGTAFLDDTKRLRFAFYCECEEMQIFTMRPYVSIFPVKSSINITHKEENI